MGRLEGNYLHAFIVKHWKFQFSIIFIHFICLFVRQSFKIIIIYVFLLFSLGTILELLSLWYYTNV
jgi:hypothetical protein